MKPLSSPSGAASSSGGALIRHEELWAGVELKIGHAEFYLEQMASALLPPTGTAMNVVIRSTGAIIDTRWQRAFYAHLDAFLAMVRSVPEVIQCCFGKDRVMSGTPWYGTLTPEEQDRRQALSTQFAAAHKTFGKHAVSSARNVSFHRTGYPLVEANITGLLGVTYIGSPVESVLVAESLRVPAGDDPALLFAATQSPTPVQPTWQNFTLDGKPLFAECQAYLKETMGRCLSRRAGSS